MHSEVFKVTGEDVVNIGSLLRSGRRYALAFQNSSAAFAVEMNLSGDWEPTEWEGGSSGTGGKVITTEFVSVVTRVRIKFAAVPASTVVIALQEISSVPNA